MLCFFRDINVKLGRNNTADSMGQNTNNRSIKHMRFQVLMAASMKMTGSMHL
jgi:hypothetical protein